MANQSNLWQQSLLAVLTSLLFAGSFRRRQIHYRRDRAVVDYATALPDRGRFFAAVSVAAERFFVSLYHCFLGRQALLISAWYFRRGGLSFLFSFFSLRYTAVANSAIINAFNPVVTGLLAALILKEKLALRNYLGGVIALLGVFGIVDQWPPEYVISASVQYGRCF